MPLSLVLCVVGLLCLTAGAVEGQAPPAPCPPAHAYQAYRDGVMALSAQDTATAIARLEQAIACDPQRRVYRHTLEQARSFQAMEQARQRQGLVLPRPQGGR